MAKDLQRSGGWRCYLHYQKALLKVERNCLRVKFLENCKRADLIPKFLQFRVPNNGCFDDDSVHNLQKRLLNNELLKAKADRKALDSVLVERRHQLRVVVPDKTLPSVAVYTRLERRDTRRQGTEVHNRKLATLSEEQERPLFQVCNTVVVCGQGIKPPKYVMQTLALGPRNAVLDRFDPKELLAEIDDLMDHCRVSKVSEETITDINVKTLAYIKRCKKMKSSRNIQMTSKYLKEHGLLAIPFDKGVGICVMRKEDYHSKMDQIIALPQFQKLVKNRRNAKNPVLKEEDRVLGLLKTLLEENKIDEALYHRLKPMGSQPARLYGLAKVHKEDTPMRPVLSMPGSVYYRIAEYVAEHLAKVPQCSISTSTAAICEKLKEIRLEEDEELISYDVVSMYTNVPVHEAIQICTDMLYNLTPDKRPNIEKDTFIQLCRTACCEVVMLTHDGYYIQKEGLAMGSSPAPHLANGWLSQYEEAIKGDSKLYERYMDDILKEEKKGNIALKLDEINDLHPKLRFTVEREIDGKLPVLDMMILHDHTNGHLESTWYSKPTDTGLTMNYHALAPKRYKRSVVTGFVYRIYRSCSTWQHFHQSLEKAKRILEQNQYPPTFYGPLIRQALHNIFVGKEQSQVKETTDTSNITKKILRVQYRGKSTEHYARALHKINAPCTVVMTLRKLKTALPSLKPPVAMFLKSGIVYEIQCPRCKACYVGQSGRHLQDRFTEHRLREGPVKTHYNQCSTTLMEEHVRILHSTTRGEKFLQSLEALYIRERNPSINTRDEWRSRELKIKL